MQIRCGCTGCADHRCRLRGYILVLLKRLLCAFVFQPEVVCFVRRAAVDECLGRSRNAMRYFAIDQSL